MEKNWQNTVGGTPGDLAVVGHSRTGPRAGERGLSMLDWLVAIAVAMFVIIKGLSIIGSPLYDYYIMKDMAKRIAKEFQDLPMAEVVRRAKFELDRNQIPWDDDAFTITALNPGYSVDIDFRIPLKVTLGTTVFAEDKEWRLTYHVEP